MASKQEPSCITKNEKPPLESLRFLTQPLIVTVVSKAISPWSACLIEISTEISIMRFTFTYL